MDTSLESAEGRDSSNESMETANTSIAPELADEEDTLPSLSDILAITSTTKARECYEATIPCSRQHSNAFWTTCNKKEKLIGYKASMAMYIVTKRIIVPREFQLKATMAVCTGKDALIDAGTGSGKTFCMVLPALLNPKDQTIVITPLRKLQDMQVLEFQKYGLSTLAINEDTPNDKSLWKVCELCLRLVYACYSLDALSGYRRRCLFSACCSS